MTERERMIELLIELNGSRYKSENIADHLLANGVRLPVTCGERKYYDFKHPEMVQPWGICCRNIFEARDSNDYCKNEERRADNG